MIMTLNNTDKSIMQMDSEKKGSLLTSLWHQTPGWAGTTRSAPGIQKCHISLKNISTSDHLLSGIQEPNKQINKQNKLAVQSCWLSLPYVHNITHIRLKVKIKVESQTNLSDNVWAPERSWVILHWHTEAPESQLVRRKSILKPLGKRRWSKITTDEMYVCM